LKCIRLLDEPPREGVGLFILGRFRSRGFGKVFSEVLLHPQKGGSEGVRKSLGSSACVRKSRGSSASAEEPRPTKPLPTKPRREV